MLEKNIGEVITEAREKANLSQRQLAKLANINNSELSKIESGVRKEPSPKILRKISNVLDVNYSDLMYMIGLGIEVSPLNPFIKDYYSFCWCESFYGDCKGNSKSSGSSGCCNSENFRCNCRRIDTACRENRREIIRGLDKYQAMVF